MKENTEDVFSKQGRVNWSLARRSYLLDQVQYLSRSLNIYGDMGYTCEIAEYFYLEQIQSRIEQFYLRINQFTNNNGNELLSSNFSDIFPFSNYFESSLQLLFPPSNDLKTNLAVAEGCFRHIQNIFNELSDYRYCR
jgi:intron-binding protein aquarius